MAGSKKLDNWILDARWWRNRIKKKILKQSSPGEKNEDIKNNHRGFIISIH